jgi:hypothetical protein
MFVSAKNFEQNALVCKKTEKVIFGKFKTQVAFGKFKATKFLTLHEEVAFNNLR